MRRRRSSETTSYKGAIFAQFASIALGKRMLQSRKKTPEAIPCTLYATSLSANLERAKALIEKFKATHELMKKDMPLEGPHFGR
jgi:hypothetical protein